MESIIGFLAHKEIKRTSYGVDESIGTISR